MSGLTLGLVGAGIGASLTPALHEREAREQDLLLRYHRIDAEAGGFGVEDLPELLRWARTLGFAGLNVTHPFKQAVVGLLDDVDDAAADLGAVNTVVWRGGRSVGHNTDCTGYGRAFTEGLGDAARDRVLLLGAGGAGLAVGYALLAQGVGTLTVHDADPARAEEAVVRLEKRFDAERLAVLSDPRLLPAAVGGSDGLVNATPVGMLGHPGSPVDPHHLDPAMWVSDVVYFPLETELIRAARARGCRTLPGGAMAVGQAVDAFALFTGRRAEADRMARHFAELTR
ncbi:shikimate dehydrogenase [Nocardioides fonticola]|uniref:Shikimate dehydrogenase n=1 Tax=Nocardioides fonticola TaxID=450363 RepID=A0ABP7XFY9_9ACTN